MIIKRNQILNDFENELGDVGQEINPRIEIAYLRLFLDLFLTKDRVYKVKYKKLINATKDAHGNIYGINLSFHYNDNMRFRYNNGRMGCSISFSWKAIHFSSGYKIELKRLKDILLKYDKKKITFKSYSDELVIKSCYDMSEYFKPLMSELLDYIDEHDN